MPLGLLGKKLGMTRLFDEQAGSMVPVTVIDVSGNTFLQAKSADKEGYTAVQVGYDSQKEQRVTKPALAHFKKHGSEPKRLVREFRFAPGEAVPDVAADHPGAALFEVGQGVDVIGISKGKGFQGAVKRHGFGGLKDTHGSMMHRRTGAIGCRSTPGRVWKNQSMPGHDGSTRNTIQNLRVMQVRTEEQVVLVSGAVPGAIGSYVTIRPAKKTTLARKDAKNAEKPAEKKAAK
jgi:large subunit ribosomal protein L3